MLDRKYFNPIAYIREFERIVASVILALGVSFRVVTKVDGFRITFLVASYKEYLLRAQQSYRREEVTMYWLRTLIGADDVVYDIGANVGAYSLYAGNLVMKGSGPVYAFEPAFPNFFPLCRNIELNHFNETVIPYPIAFGQSTCESKFFLRSTERGDARHGLSEPRSEGMIFDPEFLQGTYVTSLDEFISAPGVAFPNHVKIDVDGTESDIIAGMESVMKDERLKTIMIEINGDISQGGIETTITERGLEEVMTEQWAGKNTFNKLFVRK